MTISFQESNPRIVLVISEIQVNIVDNIGQSKNYIKSNFSSKKNTKNTVDILTDRSEYNIPSKEISNKSRKSLALIQKQNQDLIDKLSKISKEKQTLENQIKLRANKKPYYRIIK